MKDAMTKYDKRIRQTILLLAVGGIITNLVAFVAYLYGKYNFALVCKSNEALQHQSWAKVVLIISLLLACGMFVSAAIKLLDTSSSSGAQQQTAFRLNASLFLLLGLVAGIMTFFALYDWLVEFPQCAA